MKIRLIRFIGAIALGLLITSMVVSCSKTQSLSKKHDSQESISNLPAPPPVRQTTPPPPPNPSSVTTTSAPQGNANGVNRYTPKPAVVGKEVVEDDAGGYDDYYAADPPQNATEAQRKEEEKRNLDQEVKDLQQRMREVEDMERRDEADRRRMQQDLARIEERAVLKQEEIQQAREREELEKVKSEKSEAAYKKREQEIIQNQKKRKDEIETQIEAVKMQAGMASSGTPAEQTAETEKLKKELEEIKKQEALVTQSTEPVGREDYAHIDENDFTSPLSEPLSTFSIDVDKAAYANTRRYLNSGSLPPAGAVRIEELINYFHYDYRQPFSSQPFAFNTEASSCPWNSEHQLVHIGLKGRVIDRSEMPASNLVFLIDVSGSMNNANKLPLLKQAFSMLIENLTAEDRVAIVVYAGAAGVVLPSTSASEKGKILQALNNLSAGGSTAGGAGIQLAYQIARNHFKDKGNNRVILATDGDFNVGPSSESALIEMIESKRKEGVFLSVLGFGTGNYQDRRMEQLADHGNGNYAYIDNLQEAQKVLVQEMGGTLHAIAKDVKIQIEFNPTYVKAYRLIGYENRSMAAQDFNDDTKDAGELGAGHTVTALYEIVPHSAHTPVAGIDQLRYQQITPSNISTGAELMTIKFRYKEPDGNESKLLTEVVKMNEKTLSETSDNYRFAASVAAFGMLLRGSRYSGDADYDMVYDMASHARGNDPNGYRREFLQLVQRAKAIDNRGAITGN